MGWYETAVRPGQCSVWGVMKTSLTVMKTSSSLCLRSDGDGKSGLLKGAGSLQQAGKRSKGQLESLLLTLPCPCPRVAQREPCIQTSGGLQPPSLKKRSGTHSSTGKSEKLSLTLAATKITCPPGHVDIRNQQGPPAPMGQKKWWEGGQALLPFLPRVCTESPPCHWPQQPFLLGNHALNPGKRGFFPNGFCSGRSLPYCITGRCFFSARSGVELNTQTRNDALHTLSTEKTEF